MDTRFKHIDIAKGVAIVLVVLNHSSLNIFFPEIFSSMSLFRMPLFFFLSGLFFSYSLTPVELTSKKSQTLLKPYFSIMIFLLLLSIIIQEDNLISKLKGIIYGNGITNPWGVSGLLYGF